MGGTWLSVSIFLPKRNYESPLNYVSENLHHIFSSGEFICGLYQQHITLHEEETEVCSFAQKLLILPKKNLQVCIP
jgi:hypothetical protein